MGNPEISILPSTLKAVKEIVDELFDLTSKSPYYGGFTGSTSRYRQIARILVARGSLVRSGNRLNRSYKWNEHAMAPTKVFYQSVAEELVKHEREIRVKNLAKKKALKKEMPETQEPAPQEEKKDEHKSVLASFSDRALLDELLRRGWVIGNGELTRQERLS